VRTYHFTIFGKKFGKKWADKHHILPILAKMGKMEKPFDVLRLLRVKWVG